MQDYEGSFEFECKKVRIEIIFLMERLVWQDNLSGFQLTGVYEIRQI